MNGLSFSIKVIPLLVLLQLVCFRQVQAETTECTVIDAIPYNITTQGVYCLKGNLSGNLSINNAIHINTNNVTIDLNGYKLGNLSAGFDTTAKGIYAYQRKNITIKNGTIRGFYRGIYIMDTTSYEISKGHLIEDMRVDQCTYEGIVVGASDSIIRNNQVVDTGGSPYASWAHGIRLAGPNNRVINNDVFDAIESGASGRSYGIYSYGDSSVFINNRVGNFVIGPGTSVGIYIGSSENVLVANNTLTTLDIGIDFDSSSTGKYRDNLTTNCATAFDVPLSVIDAGNND